MTTTTTKISAKSENLITDKLGVVCCYFNPCNYLSRYINFISFYQSIEDYDNIELVVVESYSQDSTYRVDKVCADVISIESDEIYWQKEQLLNMGIQKLLLSGYECISWVDADIIFLNEDWVTNSLESIRRSQVVQLFETCIKKLPNRTKHIVSKSTSSFFKQGVPPIEKLLTRPGEPGFAYGYHRDVLKTFKLYENAIVGSGDFLNYVGCLYTGDEIYEYMKTDRFFNKCNPSFLEDYISWVNDNNTTIDNIEVPPNVIEIEYHGSHAKRSYVSREGILRSSKFCPTLDLSPLPTGMYRLNNDKLKKHISSYFYSRSEDDFIGSLNKNRSYRNKILKLILKNNPDYTTQKIQLENLHELIYQESTDPHECMPTVPTKCPVVIVSSKTTEKFFATKRIKGDVHITIDKSPHVQKNTIKSEMPSGDPQVYLSFIIKNYDSLPESCVFISDILKRHDDSYQKSIGSVIKNLKHPYSGVNYITPIYKNFYVNETVHILAQTETNTTPLSKFNYVNWTTEFIPNSNITLLRRIIGGITHHMITKDGVQLRFNPHNSFIVSRSTIQKNERSFYEKLHSRLVGVCDTEEMLYISRSWDLIFS